MHIYEPTPVEDYLRYYNNQAGFGQAHPGITTYKGPIYQRGNGLGSIFSSLLRVITPIFKSNSVRKALKTAGTSALSTGLNVGNDFLQGKNFKESLKHRAGETGANLLESAAEELRNLSGRGYKRGRKRKSSAKKKKPAKRRKVVRRKSTKKKSSNKKRKVTKRRRKTRKQSIFD